MNVCYDLHEAQRQIARLTANLTLSTKAFENLKSKGHNSETLKSAPYSKR